MAGKPAIKATPRKLKKEIESVNLAQEINDLAYRLYEKRGRVHGHDMNDWLEAERIVHKKK